MRMLRSDNAQVVTCEAAQNVMRQWAIPHGRSEPHLPNVPSPDLGPGYYAVHLLPVFFVPRTIVLHIFFLYPILLIALITNTQLSVVVRRAIYRWCRVSVITLDSEGVPAGTTRTH